jgi:hypothetical protein
VNNAIVALPKLLMKNLSNRSRISGKIPLVLLWLLGIPVPILIIIFLFRGCAG